MNPIQLELCAASIEALSLAKAYRFDRIELCQNLEQGGTTPSAGLIQQALDLGLETHVLIRPRAGGFHYSPEELALIKQDVQFCCQMGVKGVVVGLLKANFEIDKEGLQALMACAPNLDWTFHRAFDESVDWKRSLDILLELGFKRVLTSGFASNVELGLPILGQMAAYANGRIEIMAGGGVNAGNMPKLSQLAHLAAVHFSATQKELLDEDSAFSETILKVSETRLQRILAAIPASSN
ncbi:MAG: copper homeostasis protein CutC [Flavobacteriales bacterium]